MTTSGPNKPNQGGSMGLDRPTPVAGPFRTHMHDRVDSIIRDICELPDRTSPEGQPDVMLVSDGELRDILWRHLEGLG